jgi:hypothetical protein
MARPSHSSDAGIIHIKIPNNLLTQILLIPERHVSTLYDHQCQCLYLHLYSNCIQCYYILVSVNNVNKIKMKGSMYYTG